MRSLSMPPSGRTNSCAADSDNPDIPAADKKNLETPERLPKSAALHSRLSALFKSSASAATLALYMTAGADIANAQFICQQYGGSFGGATAGSLAIACGTNANASATGSTAFGNLTAASGTYSMAVGNVAKASGANATALGAYASSSGSDAAAIGGYSQASGTNATAVEL